MHEDLSAPLRGLRIIVLAFLAGIVLFGIVAFAIGPVNPKTLDETGGMIGYIALGFSVVIVGARLVVPGLLDAHGRRRVKQGYTRSVLRSTIYVDVGDKLGDEGRLFLVFQGRTIVGAAMLEGAALFNCAAYLIEGQIVNLGFAAALCVGLALEVPGRDRFDGWLEAQKRAMREEH